MPNHQVADVPGTCTKNGKTAIILIDYSNTKDGATGRLGTLQYTGLLPQPLSWDPNLRLATASLKFGSGLE